MIETVGVMATAIWGAVEALKSTLMQFEFFKSLTEQQQSLVLQVLAWFLGALVGFAYQVNALASVPAFSAIPATVGYILTGLIAATGSAGIHIIFALLAVRAGVTADTQSSLPKAQAATNTITRKDYAPFL